MKALYLLTALTITCSNYGVVRTCRGPGGYRSTETTINGFTSGRDNDSYWTRQRFNNQDFIKVTPKR